MDYLIVAVAMLAIAIGCGFWAGGVQERAKLRHRFIYGASIVTIMAGVFAAFVWSTFAKNQEPMTVYFDYGVTRWSIIMGLYPLEITPEVALAAALVVILLAMFAGLIAFNCRRNANRWYIALGAIVISGLAGYYFLDFGFYGLFALLVLLFKISWNSGPAVLGLWLILTAILCVIWTLHSFWGKHHSWKTLLSALGIGVGIYLGAWLLALAAAYPYAWQVKKEALRQNIVPYRMEMSLPPEANITRDKTDSFHAKHELFELPVNGVYDWMPKAGQSSAELIPPARREETLKLFDTPAAWDYYNALEELMQYGAGNDVECMGARNCIRAYARICAGRAALYHETNQPNKILPVLMKMSQIDEKILKDRPSVASELTRLACRSLWYTYLIMLGPDDAQYAPTYRQALNFMKSRKIHLPSGAEGDLDSLNQIHPQNYREVLTMPLMLALAAKDLSYALAAGPELEKLSQMEVFGECRPKDSPSYKMTAQISRRSIVMGTTGLALKLYRAEHGQYPGGLDLLVPAYLEKLPVSPISGKPLVYQSDSKSFTLSLPDPSHHNCKLDSVKEY